jgi:hypothetical protein
MSQTAFSEMFVGTKEAQLVLTFRAPSGVYTETLRASKNRWMKSVLLERFAECGQVVLATFIVWRGRAHHAKAELPPAHRASCMREWDLHAGMLGKERPAA